MRRHPGAAFAACFTTGLVLILGGCDRAPGEQRDAGPVTLTLHADSIIQMDQDTLVNGSVSTQCSFGLQANVEGPEGEHAILRGGRVEYVWWQSGRPAGTYEWSQEDLGQFWGDTILAAGSARGSQEHGFSQSEPARPVRGTVTFRYATSNAETEQETEPFRFFCY